jgi:Proteasome maturation factor UMP1
MYTDVSYILLQRSSVIIYIEQKQWKETQDNLNMQLARQVYGMHAPIRMMMNRQIATEVLYLLSYLQKC